MEIVNIRIDERLIHGQVATAWCKYLGATRIIVIDNKVVKDAINKDALKLACPLQCKLSIITTQRAVDNLLINKYEGEKLFIIVKSPETLCEIYDLGYHFDSFNVGNMGGKSNTKMVKKSVSVSKEDIEKFRNLENYGIKITAQMVPTDEKVDFMKLVKKEFPII